MNIQLLYSGSICWKDSPFTLDCFVTFVKIKWSEKYKSVFRSSLVFHWFIWLLGITFYNNPYVALQNWSLNKIQKSKEVNEWDQNEPKINFENCMTALQHTIIAIVSTAKYVDAQVI